MARPRKQTPVTKALELPKIVDFDTLLGETATLYQTKEVAPNCFQLGQVLFEVVEDENDGYRSSMQEVKVLREVQTLAPPLAKVQIVKSSNASETIYELHDAQDDHVWLRFGTCNMDDYYPYFVFDWSPKVPPALKRLKQLIK